MTTRGSFAGGRKRTRPAGGRPLLKRARTTLPPAWGRSRPAGRRATTNVELKFLDVDWDEAAANQSAGVISNTSSLVFIGQGVTESTRIGRKAVIKNIGWRGQLQLNGTDASATIQIAQTVRLMLVQDTQCNGAAPTVTGVGGVLASANYQAFNNLVNKGRFRVLMDKVVTLNPQAGAGNGTANDTSSVQENFTWFKACDIPIEYSGVTDPSVIADIRTNNIFGILINSGTGSVVQMDSKLRFRFADG